MDEDIVAFGSWKREQNESRGAARKEVEGVNGVVDLCICVYVGPRWREEGGEGKFICWRRAAERRSTLSSTILLFPAAPLHETFSPIGPLEFSYEIGNVDGRRCRASSGCF